MGTSKPEAKQPPEPSRLEAHIQKLIDGARRAEMSARQALAQTRRGEYKRQADYWRTAQRVLQWALKTFRQKRGA